MGALAQQGGRAPLPRIRTLGCGVLGAVAATVVAGAAPLTAAADASWAGSVCAHQGGKSITVSLSRQELVACQGMVLVTG